MALNLSELNLIKGSGERHKIKVQSVSVLLLRESNPKRIRRWALFDFESTPSEMILTKRGFVQIFAVADASLKVRGN